MLPKPFLPEMKLINIATWKHSLHYFVSYASCLTFLTLSFRPTCKTENLVDGWLSEEYAVPDGNIALVALVAIASS